MSYVGPAEFKAWVSVDDTFDDTQIQTVLDAASRNIDRVCGRRFTLETAATKTYLTHDPNRLEVTDLIAVTSITVDVTGNHTFTRTLTTANYELSPYQDETGAASVRFQEVRIWPTSTVGFSPGHLTRIVGNFGYVDEDGLTPADIKQACLILASRLWKRRETPFGVLSLPDIGSAVQLRKTDPDVASLLAPYALSGAATWVVV